MDLLTALSRQLLEHNIDEIGFVVADPEGEGDTRVASAFKLLLPEGVTHVSKLGIAFWAIPPLYQHAIAMLKAKDRSDAAMQFLDSVSVDQLLQLSQAIVLINAECHTAWNVRKSIIRHHRILWSPIMELKFLQLVLRKHPKSEETWSHRFWVAKAQGWESVDFVQEFEVCQECCERYPRNYYAWSYRSALAAALRHSAHHLLTDLEGVRTWAKCHVSDGSAYTHMQHLLLLLPDDEGASQIQKQLAYTNSLLEAYREHESLWIHKRWLAQQLVKRNLLTELKNEWQGVQAILADVHKACQSVDPLVDAEAEASASAFAISYCLWLVEELILLRAPLAPAELTDLDAVDAHGEPEKTGPLAAALDRLGAECGDWCAVRQALRTLLISHTPHFRTLSWWST